MNKPRIRFLASLSVLFACAAISRTSEAQAFTLGDLYLHTPAATGISSSDGGVLRIDPTTGASTLIVDLDGVDGGYGAIAYDPYRDRLLFSGRIGGVLQPKLLWESDAVGNTQSLGFSGQQFRALAPTGDGRVYYRDVGPAGGVSYLDAANQLHQLMDASGTQPFRFVPGGFFHYQVMLYHAPTQSLIAAAGSGQPDCSGAAGSTVVVRRVALSPDGARAVGPVLCGTFEVSTSGESAVGLSLMDDGDLLLVVDTNSNAQESRMVRVDPVTLAMTSFAANGGYQWAAATNAGTFSSALGTAVILNTGGDDLRTYSAGQLGAGGVISTTLPVSPAGSSGEIATLIQVRDQPCGGSWNTYGDGLAGNGGFVPSLTGTGCPVPANTVSLHVASVSGGAPGVLAMGSMPASVPLFGGTLLVTPTVQLSIVVGGTPGVAGVGATEVVVPLPNNPALSGQDFYFQAGFLDLAAPAQFSLTGGVAMTIG